MTVQWCDPPQVGQPFRWAPVLRVCLNRPGEWALVRDDYYGPNSASCAAHSLRRGSTARSRPAGPWEFRAGRIDDGRWGVWARWLGEDQ